MEIAANLADNIAENLDEDMGKIKEDFSSVKPNTLNLYVPLGEKMRNSCEIKEKLIEINKEVKGTQSQISSLECTVQFNSRILYVNTIRIYLMYCSYYIL